jgi:hypothetical protein
MANIVNNVTNWLNLEAQLALSDPSAAWKEFWATFGPGGKLHPKAFIEHRYHLIIEALLIVGIVYLLIQRRVPTRLSPDALTEKVCTSSGCLLLLLAGLTVAILSVEAD